jgi:hypothetical protein
MEAKGKRKVDPLCLHYDPQGCRLHNPAMTGPRETKQVQLPILLSSSLFKNIIF